jgi:hypothetical protein
LVRGRHDVVRPPASAVRDPSGRWLRPAGWCCCCLVPDVVLVVLTLAVFGVLLAVLLGLERL